MDVRDSAGVVHVGRTLPCVHVAEGIVKTMRTTKFKIGAALLLTAGLAGLGGFGQHTLIGKEPAADSELTTRVDKLVKAWEPVAQERRFDDIGWARDIRDALRLAKEHNRPVFLFTYSGSADREHAMALQRC